MRFTKGFNRAEPEDRMSLLEQAMKQMRAEYSKAQADARIKRQHEDARNAEAIRATATS